MNTALPNDNGVNRPFSLLSLMTILFKRKWIIMIFSFLIISLTALYSFLVTPVYKASSKLIVEREVDSEKALLFRMNLPSEYEKYDRINSEIEIIKSYPVAYRVVKELELDRLSDNHMSLTELEKNYNFERTVRIFQQKLKVYKVKLSNVVQISYEGADPDKITEIVDKVISVYIDYRSEIYDESDTYKFFEAQMQIADQKVRDLEEQQADYKENKSLISPELFPT